MLTRMTKVDKIWDFS